MTSAGVNKVSALVAALCGLALLAMSAGDAKADRRIALVVGNANYHNPSLVLSNPKNDAEDVVTALRSLGFEVLQAIDANKRDLDINMAKFARLATDSDAALFYYAGHALQYQGRNYLMPIDAEVEDEVSLRYQMMPIEDVRAALDRSNGVKVMILDACRNNPVVETLRRRASGDSRAIGGGARGLARIDKTQGMVIAYSTAADEIAADGQGRNSPFTGALLRRLKEPGLEIEQLFRRVAADVNAATGGRQRPETYVSLLSDYYLNQTDRLAYDKIKDTGDTAALQNFIASFPTSSYAPDARYRIQRIELEAQERQLQQARQQEALRLLEGRRQSEVEAAARKLEEQRLEQERAKAAEAAEAARQQAEREAVRRAEQERQRVAVARTEPPAAAEDTSAPRRVDATTSGPASAPVTRPGNSAAKTAAVERLDQPAPAASATAPVVPAPTLTPSLSPSLAPSPAQPAASGANCDQDATRLAQLRSAPSLEAVIAFERELSCDRLRPQVARLRESLAPAPPPPAAPSPVQPAAGNATSPPPSTVQPAPAPKTPDQVANLNSQPSSATSEDTPACRRDEARLARLRAKPTFADVVAFERELGCERLRPQLARLHESLAPLAAAPGQAGDGSSDRQVAITPAESAAASQGTACERDRARLARLRTTQAPRNEILRFEKELTCEELRSELRRLRAKRSGG